MGRPVDQGRYSIDEIEDFDEIDDADGFSDRQDNSWCVQVAAGDVKQLSREQVIDFHRLGIINGQTYVWQKGMQQWLPLSTFIAQPEPPPADDSWQVLMGPGDIRQLSLEQLDDFYRLGVIDEQTHVWQAGMKEWSTLSNLIGADEEQQAEDCWYAMMGPGDVRTLTLEQLDDLFRLDVLSEQTPLWQPGMSQWLPLGTVAGIEPSPPRAVVPTAPRPIESPYMSSAPPLAISIGAPELKTKSGSWLIRLSIAAGLLLTLYRNDTLYSMAQAARQQEPFARAEQRVFGGPLFGTTRSVDRMINVGGGRLATVRLPYIVTQMHEAAMANAAAQPTSKSAAASVPPQSAATSALPASVAASPEPKTVSDAKSAADPKQPTPNPVATVAAEGARSKFATVKPVSMPRAAKKSSAKGQPVFRAKGDYYDPLNPSM
jgi:hypothetical protein